MATPDGWAAGVISKEAHMSLSWVATGADLQAHPANLRSSHRALNRVQPR